jgi:hypothetical protein
VAKRDVGSVQEGLFNGFLAPLVIGGTMMPERPIGGKMALAMEAERPLGDIDLVSHVQLARVRLARRLAPVDRFAGPSAEEWALGATLHDIVQATHPGFNAVLRKKLPNRLLDIVIATLERIPPPANVAEGLSRHTWFSRIFEITRTDVDLKWWTGSAKFLGEEPPARLKAWPGVRRVIEDRHPRPLMTLPESGGVVDPYKFASAVQLFLRRTPLTDLVMCDRAQPAFVWTPESLALASTRGGRTLALRAFGHARSRRGIDAALGRATRQLVLNRAYRALGVAADFLGEKSLGEAEERIAEEANAIAADTDQDAGFAQATGALVARRFIATRGECFSDVERMRLLSVLNPLATSTAAKAVEALLSPPSP